MTTTFVRLTAALSDRYRLRRELGAGGIFSTRTSCRCSIQGRRTAFDGRFLMARVAGEGRREGLRDKQRRSGAP